MVRHVGACVHGYLLASFMLIESTYAVDSGH